MFSLLILYGIINIINGCCDLHSEEATCLAEEATDCVWIEQSHSNLVKFTKPSGDQNCVTETALLCLEAQEKDQQTPWKDLPECESVVDASPDTGPTCSFAPCETTSTTKPMNIQFIIDESGSVGPVNYRASVDFTQNLIQNDCDDDTHISVFSFSSITDRLWSFADNQNGRYDILQYLETQKDRQYYQASCTDTLTALETALVDFDRASDPNRSNYIFLITDGVPTCHCDTTLPTCSTGVCDGSERAEKLQRELNIRGITIITLGVGKFEKTAIKCLSAEENVHEVDDFDKDAFSILEEEIRKTTCPDYLAAINESYYSKIIGYSLKTFNATNLYIKGLIMLSMFIGGLAYHFREKICDKDGKYTPLLDSPNGQSNYV